jgi:hypothetical protein
LVPLQYLEDFVDVAGVGHGGIIGLTA